MRQRHGSLSINPEKNREDKRRRYTDGEIEKLLHRIVRRDTRKNDVEHRRRRKSS